MNKRIKKVLRIVYILVFFMLGVIGLISPGSAQINGLPEGFVYIDELIPDAILEVRYFSSDNFLGCKVDGYLAPKIILTIEAAEALTKVANELREQNLILKLFDGYRPQEAVNHFIRWAEDVEDQKMKDKYYPDVDKKDVFKLGYIAKRSGHSRGSTIDLTLADITTEEELDMGSGFDFFGEISHHGTDKISEEQFRNRDTLRDAMVRYGFEPYSKEWWHYTLLDEPYHDTYFTFPVE